MSPTDETTAHEAPDLSFLVSFEPFDDVKGGEDIEFWDIFLGSKGGELAQGELFSLVYAFCFDG